MAIHKVLAAFSFSKSVQSSVGSSSRSSKFTSTASSPSPPDTGMSIAEGISEKRKGFELKEGIWL
jgi:hypothetical protein